MFDFISFGSGSSGNCYYLFTENDGILIDLGVGLRALKKSFHDYGFDFMHGFSNVLITHDHADHIKSVGSLSKKFSMPVWATREVHGGIDANYSVKCKIAHSRRMYVERGKEFVVGDFVVKAFAVPHDSTDNVGYMVKHGNTTFSILTDVGRITDEMKDVISQTDYLVIEANYDEKMLLNGPYPAHLQERIRSGRGHLSNVQCARALVENSTERLKHVWLCHLSEENNTPQLALDCVSNELAKAGFPVGDTLLVDVLRRKLPTGVFHLI